MLTFRRRHLTTAINKMQVFNRDVKLKQRNLITSQFPQQSRQVDYLRTEVAERLVDRLLDIKKQFPRVLDLGAQHGQLFRQLDGEMGIKEVVMLDRSRAAMERDLDILQEHADREHIQLKLVECDEEQFTKSNNFSNVSKEPFDAVLSSLSMHWINDLPGVMVQCERVLKPDGLFLGAMFGNDTLFELRCSLQLAEMERRGGLAPHVSPFTQPPDVADLLMRTGFQLTTIDVDDVCVHYPSVFELMNDLQMMGEQGSLLSPSPLSRDTLLATAAIYRSMYGKKVSSVSSDMEEEDSLIDTQEFIDDADQEIVIPATFQVIYFIGWKRDPSRQPQPLKRGTAQHSIKDLDNLISSSTSDENIKK